MTVAVFPAATVLMLRDGPGGVEVLMLLRPQHASAFPGALVFPGGRLEPDDTHPDWTPPDDKASALAPSDHCYAVAATREAFEECGLLLARPATGPALLSGERQMSLAAWRSRLANGAASLRELCRCEHLRLALDLLVPFGHWITPRTQPRLFDTRFFLAPAPPEQQASHDGVEALQSQWLAPREVLARAASGELNVLFPTRMSLLRLARSSCVEEALARARAEPVVTVQPEVTPHPCGKLMIIPRQAGYGASRVLVPATGGPLRFLD